MVNIFWFPFLCKVFFQSSYWVFLYSYNKVLVTQQIVSFFRNISDLNTNNICNGVVFLKKIVRKHVLCVQKVVTPIYIIYNELLYKISNYTSWTYGTNITKIRFKKPNKIYIILPCKKIYGCQS